MFELFDDLMGQDVIFKNPDEFQVPGQVPEGVDPQFEFRGQFIPFLQQQRIEKELKNLRLFYKIGFLQAVF